MSEFVRFKINLSTLLLNRKPATCWEALVGTGFESRWV